MKQKTKVILFLIIIFLLSVTIITLEFIKNTPKSEDTSQPPIIGGDKDEYGCLIAAGYSWNETLHSCARQWEIKECTPESKTAQVCNEMYSATCGWFDSERIQCIKYPCAQTYSNSCFACADEKVKYITEGECPK